MIGASTRRHVIIGAGVAAIAAAQAIRSVDPHAEITLVTEDPFGYYSRPALAYYLTGELDERQLFPFNKKDIAELNVKMLNARVINIHPRQQTIGLENRTRIPYDRLLIATGSQAVPLAVPGADSRDVYKLDNLSDARAILKAARHVRSAVVAGGGITALELVEGLRAQGVQVHYFLRGDRYWSNVLDETESRIVEYRLKQHGVRLYHTTELAALVVQRGRVKAAVTKDGREIPCQMLAYAIGVRPRLELAQTAELAIERGILTDEHMQTSQPNIYAAGDVAQAFDPFIGQRVLDTLWDPARQQGYVAGMNMAGAPTVFRKSATLNVTRLSELTVTIIGTVGRGTDPSLEGIARGDSETWRSLPDAVTAEKHQDVNRLRLMLDHQHILGAIVMGDQALSLPVQELVNQRVDISAIREELLNTQHLGDCVAAFWTQWRSNHASEKP